MLVECAKGHTFKELPHNFCVYYGGKTYPSLPRYTQMEVGHVKKMVRHLGLDVECVNRHLGLDMKAPQDQKQDAKQGDIEKPKR
jgi:hypothetical protein